MVAAPYCPKKGDIIWISFQPQSGREILKRRPALVLSPTAYNQRARLCVICPLSSRPPRHLFEIAITLQGKQGAVVVDQIKSLDWHSREAEFIEKAKKSIVKEVQERLRLFLFDSEA